MTAALDRLFGIQAKTQRTDESVALSFKAAAATDR